MIKKYINAQSASLRSLLAAESRAEQRAQVEIASWQKLLRPKSPDENPQGEASLSHTVF